MNRLTAYLREHGINEVSAMNRLQDHGIISDNAVHASDVADCDAEAAIEFLLR